MKATFHSIFLLAGLMFIAPIANSQLTCPQFTATGPSASGYNTTSDPACSVCGSVGTTPWTGFSCGGTIVVTATPATTSLTMGFTSVNTDDFATLSIDGGGVMTLTAVNMGVSGNVVGPYNCSGPYGDVFVTVNSTLPFTTVNIVNTGCSSGWVIACPGSTPNAGADDLTNPICSGTLDLNTLLVGGDAGGVWDETTTSGQFNAGTGVFTVGGLTPGTYDFTYTVTSCGATDVSNFSVQVGGGGNAGPDNTTAICGGAVPSLNLNTLLSGADPGGTWAETTSSGQFNTGTGVLNTVGLPGGSYTFTYTLTGVAPCPTDVATITVNIDPGPIADFDYTVNGISSAGGPVTACITNPITFDNNSTIPSPGTIATTTWDYGNGDGFTGTNPPAYTYPGVGTFIIELTVESSLGCTDVMSIPIEITNGPTLTVSANDPTCYQFNDGSVTINTAGAGTYTFQILNSLGTQLNIANSNTANNLVSGWYYLNVDDGLGCAGVDSVFLDQPGELNADLIINQPLCYGVPNGLVIADTVYNYTGSYANVGYYWNPNPSGTNGIGKDSCIQLGPGTYSLTLNDENGCSNTVDFTIVYPDSLYFIELGSEPAYCRLFSYQSGNGVVFAAASGGTPDYSYGWTNIVTGAATANTTWGGLNPGTYQVSVTDDNGCTLSETITLDSLNPVADFEMTSPQFTSNYFGTAPVDVHFINQSLYFANPNDPNADTTFFWNFNEGTSGWTISHDVNETFDSTYLIGGEYQVCLVAINKNGCADTLCKPLIIYNPLAFTPVNVFTPDGDGSNDTFSFVEYAEGVKEFSCVIVNRWGLKIHEMSAITDTWDGTDMNGDKCTDGVYFYTYEGTAENGALFNGQGTLEILHSK
ncbi:MAG: gliding motility-associated C-terminal domain-containing protein [Bacteroidetes bacterium]|nr:gliding motility-associated C-terminal domain-containing protein [Bacteroidota bacterium]